MHTAPSLDMLCIDYRCNAYGGKDQSSDTRYYQTPVRTDTSCFQPISCTRWWVSHLLLHPLRTSSSPLYLHALYLRTGTIKKKQKKTTGQSSRLLHKSNRCPGPNPCSSLMPTACTACFGGATQG